MAQPERAMAQPAGMRGEVEKVAEVREVKRALGVVEEWLRMSLLPGIFAYNAATTAAEKSTK